MKNKAYTKIGRQSGVSGKFTAACAVLLLLFAPRVQAAERQVLHGHVPAVTVRLLPLGSFPGTNRLNLAIGLPLRNREALTNLLRQIYDPASPNFHHYLTPEQFTKQFGPTAKDYQGVIAFARANGLTVTGTHPNRMLVDVSGSVADIEKAFRVTMLTYRHPTENRTFFAPDAEPSLDLLIPILDISGLDNYSLPRPRFEVTPLANTQNVSPSAGSGPSGTYMGKDFRAAYLPDSSLNGSGQIVGLLQFDGYTAGDISYYENQAGLPSITLSNVLIDGASGLPSGSGGEVEVSLDIEMAISMATNLSQVVVYMAPNPSPWEDLLNRMANDNLAKQLSCSWYQPGGGSNAVADQIFQQMAAQGQSFFNASGDNDAYTGLIDFPGDTPYITQVGGTTLTTSGPRGAWVSETVWNWGNGTGSGGGISTQYPIPNWQTNINMTANQGSTTKRNTPDVALTANNIYVRADGLNYTVGGTSCASPLWAGFAALVNQQAAADGRPTVGFINPAVDVIGSGVNYTLAFHDITTGNNTSPGSPTKFYAVSGYDLCTGWGTPAGQKLINALANPEALVITPSSGFTSIGGVGGPFTITSQSLSLTNAGTNSLTWTLVNTSLWLNASPGGGTLMPGGPAANVAVSLNSAASNLVVGAYSATVWFTNLNSGVGQSRQFGLSVISPPTITTQPTNQAVLEGATATFTVGATGGLPLYYQWQDDGTNLTDSVNVSGSTTTNLVISDVTAANVGTYTFIATNVAGTAISSNALLTITPSPPVITMQPSNQTVVVDTTARFIVAVIGTTPFSFQWSFNGTNMPGETNSMLILSDVQLSQAGTYAVAVTNIYGSIQSSNADLIVTPCDPVPAGLVAWWAAENNALDRVGGNNGTLMNGAGFASGEVGSAFNLNGVNQFVLANSATPSSLNVGLGSGFTMEGWINPTTLLHGGFPLFEYERSLGTSSGADVGVFIYANVTYGAGDFLFNIVDTSGNIHPYYSSPGLIVAGAWQHIALTYDKASGVAALYVNGLAVGQTNFGSFTPQTSFTNLLIGARTTFGSVANPPDRMAGEMDEMSLYNRALSASEIQAIYQAGSAGKCVSSLAPVITTQPTNQAVLEGATATFTVGATGGLPLYYQWQDDGTNLTDSVNVSGSTTTNLVISDVTAANVGTYTFIATNVAGTAISSNALLTITPSPPVITMQPSNQTVVVDTTARFIVAVIGTTPFSFQWSFNGTNMPGETNSMLILSDVQLSQAGTYAVAVTNIYGSIQSSNADLIVTPCDPVPAGLVAWWAAENNALDRVGGNNGTLMNGAGFASGEVGSAFNLNGVNQFVLANSATPSSLNVGLGSGFTMEGWINPTTLLHGGFPLFEYERSLGTSSGADVGVFIYANVTYGAGDFLFNIVDTSGNIHPYYSSPGLIVAGAWQHIALTYDKASGVAALYVNGLAVGQTNFGSFTPQTSFTNLLIGARTTFGSVANPPDRMAGEMDEMSLYNRALSASEIQAIYQAGSAGKCVSSLAPVITTQPTNQAVLEGATATFTVGATGALPLSYQWSFNGTNAIVGTTNAMLTLANVKLSNAGPYSVTVTNLYGATTSSNAVLTVIDVLDHFVWNPIPSPRFVNAPFAVAIQAMDATNRLFTNFIGTVLLTATNGVSVNPPVSTNFVQGVWTGQVTITRTISNLVLRADDGAGHTGLANSINVINAPSLGMAQSGNFLLIFWPVDPAGFVLESSASLAPAQWSPVSAPPFQIGNQYLESVQIDGTNQFYRLRFTLP